MKKLLLKIVFTLLIIIIILTGQQDLSSRSRRSEIMDINDFIAQMKDIKDFIIRVDGTSHESYFTLKKYVHYETIAFYGQNKIHSTHQVLYNTENDFYILHKDLKIKISYRKIRTHLSPSIEKKYSIDELKSADNDKEKSFLKILKENDSNKLLIAEYGLNKKKNYHARFKTETYHLPPRRPGGKPKKKENTILMISDQPFPNKIELTPIYKGWSY